MSPPYESMPSGGAPRAVLPERLRMLMERHYNETGEKLSATSLSALIRQQGGTVSHTTLASILNGSNTNPSLKTLEEVARFFRQPVAVLTGDALSSQRPVGDPRYRTLPEKLVYLGEMRRRIHPHEQHSMEDVARILDSEHQVQVTPDDLERVWTDPCANPQKDLLEALARYHHVPAGYLLDDGDLAGRVEEQLSKLANIAELRRAAADAGVLDVAARLGDLEPGQLAAVIAVVNSYVHQSEDRRSGRDERS